MPDLSSELTKVLPGAVGAGVSMLFVRGVPWPQRVGMVCGGAAFAYWGSPWASKWAQLDVGFAGFLLGLLGMQVVAKAVDTWGTFEIGGLLSDFIRKWLGLPARGPASPSNPSDPQAPKEL